MSYEIEEPIEWAINSTNHITLGRDDRTDDGEPLFNVIAEEYPEDAVVTVTVKDKYGQAVSGATALTMAHVVGTTGEDTIYRVQVPHTVTLAIGKYVAVATATVDGLQKTLYKEINVTRGG